MAVDTAIVMKETDDYDGLGCTVDARGVPSAINTWFTMLQYVGSTADVMAVIPFIIGKVILIGLL